MSDLKFDTKSRYFQVVHFYTEIKKEENIHIGRKILLSKKTIQ